MLEVAAILTCYNRRQKTLNCLSSLYTSLSSTQDVNLTVYLVDDGSTDQTSELVSRQFPEVKIIQGSGNLYWSGGMRLGFGQAMKTGYDFYLWLNDDVILNPSAIKELLNSYQKNFSLFGRECIVVGALSNPHDGQVIYGGYRSVGSKFVPKGQIVYSPDEDLECYSFNGNCVLIPKAAAFKVGNLNPIFIHGMGDSDYGYRCFSHGFKIFVCKDIAGCCEQDEGDYKLYSGLNQGNWKSLPLLQRLKLITSPKNFPVKPWLVFSYKYLGWLWILRFLRPYVLAIFPQFI